MQTCEATNEMATKQSFEGWPGISINQQNTYWISWTNRSTWKSESTDLLKILRFGQRCVIYLIFQLLLLVWAQRVTSFVASFQKCEQSLTCFLKCFLMKESFQMVSAETLGAELMVSSDFGLVSEPTPRCAPLCPKRFSRRCPEVKKLRDSVGIT